MFSKVLPAGEDIYRPRREALGSGELQETITAFLKGRPQQLPKRYFIRDISMPGKEGLRSEFLTTLRAILKYYGYEFDSDDRLLADVREHCNGERATGMEENNLNDLLAYVHKRYGNFISPTPMRWQEDAQTTISVMKIFLANDVPLMLLTVVDGRNQGYLIFGYTEDRFAMRDPLERYNHIPFSQIEKMGNISYLAFIGRAEQELTDRFFQGEVPEKILTLQEYNYRRELREDMIILTYGKDLGPRQVGYGIQLLDTLQKTCPPDLGIKFYRLTQSPRPKFYIDIYRDGKFSFGESFPLDSPLNAEKRQEISERIYRRLAE